MEVYDRVSTYSIIATRPVTVIIKLYFDQGVVLDV